MKESDLQTFLEHRARTSRDTGLPADCISTSQAAKRAGVKRQSLKPWIVAGELKAISLPNGRHCVNDTVLTALLKQRNRPGQMNLLQAARFAGVSSTAVRVWILTKGLPAHQFSNSRYAIKKSALRAFLKRRARMSQRSPLSIGYLSVRQAAKQASVTWPTVRAWVDQGLLPAQKRPNGFYAIKATDFKKLLATRPPRLAGKTLAAEHSKGNHSLGNVTIRKPRSSLKSVDYLSLNQAAREMGTSCEAIKLWIYKRQLPGVKQANGKWRIRRRHLIAFRNAYGAIGPRLVQIADEDNTFTDGAKSVLVAAGYQVQAFSDLENALHQVRTQMPILLVLNLNFDNGRGWAVAEQFRRHRHTRKRPILFVGATVLGKDDLARIVRVGGKGFLRKPVDSKQLLTEIQKALMSDMP